MQTYRNVAQPLGIRYTDGLMVNVGAGSEDNFRKALLKHLNERV